MKSPWAIPNDPRLLQAPASPREAPGRTVVGPPATVARAAISGEDPDGVCGCGHRAYEHVRGEGEPGDCLHREGGRFVCGCETFTPEEGGESGD